MAKSNLGYVSAGGVAGLQKGIEQLIAERVEAQELAKREALAREALWQKNLESQRDFNLQQEQLGISKGNFRLAQNRDARDAAEADKPKLRTLSNVRQAGSDNPWTITVPEDDMTPREGWRAPEKISTTPVRGVRGADGNPYTVFYDEAGNPVGKPVREYDEPKGAGAPKPPSGQQQKWMGFYEQMRAANTIIDRAEEKLNAKDLFLLNTAGLEGWTASAAYYGLSDAGKSYARAMTEFLEAGLRDASGAQFNKTEFPVRGAIYMGHTADTPAAREERRAARFRAVQNAGRKAGPAYEQEYGRGYDASTDAPADATALPLDSSGTRRRHVVTPADLATPGAAPRPGTPPPSAPRRRKLVLGANGLQEQPQ